MNGQISIIGKVPFPKITSDEVIYYPEVSEAFLKISHLSSSIIIDIDSLDITDDWIYVFDNEGKIFTVEEIDLGEYIFTHYLSKKEFSIPKNLFTTRKFLSYFLRKENTSINEEKFKIPKIIHLMWLSLPTEEGESETSTPKIISQSAEVTFPEKYQLNVDLIKKNHPNFEIKIWGWKEVVLLISEHFGKEFLAVFNSFKHLISKCDFARFCVVYVYGGVYCDLDFYFRDNISLLFESKNLLLWKEPREHQFYKYELLSNGIFAAEKENSFIRGWIEQMKVNSSLLSRDNVMITTGPEGFGKFYKSLPIEKRPLLSEGCNTLPFTKGKNLSDDCLECVTHPEKDIISYTIWDEGSGWENFLFNNDSKTKKEENHPGKLKKKKNNDFLLYITVLITVILIIVILVSYYILTQKREVFE